MSITTMLRTGYACLLLHWLTRPDKSSHPVRHNQPVRRTKPVSVTDRDYPVNPIRYVRKRMMLLLCVVGTGFTATAQQTGSIPFTTAQPGLVVPGAGRTPNGLTTLDRPEVAAFRQYLTRYETARQQSVAQFLQRHTTLRRDFVDKRGSYHFLHHIDAAGQPIYYQTRSNLGLATSIRTDKLWKGGSLGLNLQGQDMEVSVARSRLGMWEPGPTRTTHREFTNRAITRDTPLFTVTGKNPDHATHVAGTMMAAGINPLARGMANQARLDCFEIQTNEYGEMQTAAAEGMLVSNHSYGPDYDSTRVRLGVYDESAQIYDSITYQNKNYLQFHAAGNDRDDDKNITYDILIGGGIGKNVATVGAVKRLGAAGYTGPASVEIADFTSYGPTDDGRIKPDFVTPGVDILSPYSASDTTYASIQGTSMASPGAAGSLFLLQQHYRNTKKTFMRAATLKGLAIHTADEAGTSPGPDYRFGWGLLNLEKAVEVINQTGGVQIIEETSLANSATYRKPVTTSGGPFKATICWTDVPGTPLVNGGRDNRKAMLVNDLDVRLIDGATNQSVAQLPWKLDPVNPAAPAVRGDNVVDNVEQIFVDNLPAGQYFVQVTHKGSLKQGPQEFSLFVTDVATGGPIVKVNSTDPSASESGGVAPKSIGMIGQARAGTADDPGFIQFERSNTKGPLVINYEIGGTATNGDDFTTLPTSITFADGQSVYIEEIDPIEDDAVEGDETIIITLVDSDTYDPDPANTTTTLTIKDDDTASPFLITGVTTVSCQTVTTGLRRVTFTPQYTNASGQPISFSVVNELRPTTATGPYTLNLYTDNPTIALKASQSSPAGQADFTYNWLAACGSSVTPTPGSPLSITSVTMVSCQTVTANLRRVSFTPRYAGLTGQPISFSVVNELRPTTATGPYTLNLYTDNPAITLKATQSGTAGEASFRYSWLAACSGNARVGSDEPVLSVRLLSNPAQNGQVSVEVRGAAGEALQLSLTDVRGRVIGTHSIGQAGVLEQHTFEIGRQPVGLFLLRAATSTQSQTVRIIKVE